VGSQLGDGRSNDGRRGLGRHPKFPFDNACALAVC